MTTNRITPRPSEPSSRRALPPTTTSHETNPSIEQILSESDRIRKQQLEGFKKFANTLPPAKLLDIYKVRFVEKTIDSDLRTDYDNSEIFYLSNKLKSQTAKEGGVTADFIEAEKDRRVAEYIEEVEEDCPKNQDRRSAVKDRRSAATSKTNKDNVEKNAMPTSVNENIAPNAALENLNISKETFDTGIPSQLPQGKKTLIQRKITIQNDPSEFFSKECYVKKGQKFSFPEDDVCECTEIDVVRLLAAHSKSQECRECGSLRYDSIHYDGSGNCGKTFHEAQCLAEKCEENSKNQDNLVDFVEALCDQIDAAHKKSIPWLCEKDLAIGFGSTILCHGEIMPNVASYNYSTIYKTLVNVYRAVVKLVESGTRPIMVTRENAELFFHKIGCGPARAFSMRQKSVSPDSYSKLMEVTNLDNYEALCQLDRFKVAEPELRELMPSREWIETKSAEQSADILRRVLEYLPKYSSKRDKIDSLLESADQCTSEKLIDTLCKILDIYRFSLFNHYESMYKNGISDLAIHKGNLSIHLRNLILLTYYRIANDYKIQPDTLRSNERYKEIVGVTILCAMQNFLRLGKNSEAFRMYTMFQQYREASGILMHIKGPRLPIKCMRSMWEQEILNEREFSIFNIPTLCSKDIENSSVTTALRSFYRMPRVGRIQFMDFYIDRFAESIIPENLRDEDIWKIENLSRYIPTIREEDLSHLSSLNTHFENYNNLENCNNKDNPSNILQTNGAQRNLEDSQFGLSKTKSCNKLSKGQVAVIGTSLTAAIGSAVGIVCGTLFLL